MFYIEHESDNFTIIDCCITEENKVNILSEVCNKSKDKGITRFISTHPDDDHISGLEILDDKIGILNFYCVQNSAIKSDSTDSFERYCNLRDDSKKSFYIYKGCKRKWMNQEGKDNNGTDRGSSGINVLWPNLQNSNFKDALEKVKKGESPNNISPIIKYSLNDGVTALWMGDIEKDFFEKIKDEIVFPKVDILFAPHHGRESGKLPNDILEKITPKVIVIGEADSSQLNYYKGYNTIKQNTAKDIIFDCKTHCVDVYVGSSTYEEHWLTDKNKSKSYGGFYLGSFDTHN